MLGKNRPQNPRPPTREETASKMLRKAGVENPDLRNMTRNVTLSRIESFDKNTLKPANFTDTRKNSILQSHHVNNPDVGNASRKNLMDEIKSFDRSKLKAKQPEQRYIVSPHNDVRNLMNNSRGMGVHALSQNLPMVRPVFKDDNQRKAFHTLANQKLSGFGNVNNLNDEQRREHNTYSQLKDWSHKDNAMMNFESADTKRSHPIVYVQGHGSPGTDSISSDSHEKASYSSVARMLDNMKLPKVSQLRANSCHSGTEHNLKMIAEPKEKFRQQTMEQSAGKWENTFAGKLQGQMDTSHQQTGQSYKQRYEANKAAVDKIMGRELGKWGKVKAFFGGDNLTQKRKDVIDKVTTRHNRVVGYMGPTTQGPVNSTSRDNLGRTQDNQQHMAVALGANYEHRFKRSQVKRTGPSVPAKK